jgi:hypothetical protein
MGLKITPPKAKFELHAYGQIHDISNSLVEWKKNEVLLSRKDTSGIYREMTFPFKFVLDAYNIVENIFKEYGFKSKADVYIYLRNDDWTYGGGKYIFNLDFSTYNQSDTVIEINARRSDLYEFLKAKEKVNYEIPVEELKDEKQWNYERINFKNSIPFKGKISELGRNLQTPIIYKTSLQYMEADMIVKNFLLINDQHESKITETTEYFIEPIKSGRYYFNSIFYGDFYITKTNAGPEGNTTSIIKVGIYNSKEKEIESAVILEESNRLDYENPEFSVETEFFADLEAGQKYSFVFDAYCTQKTPTNELHVGLTCRLYYTVTVYYYAKHDSVSIDVIHPENLLQKLIDKITETEGYTGKPPYSAEIEDFNTDESNMIMILASESIRKHKDAKIYTSYLKFRDFLYAFGYEPYIESNSIKFKKRDKLFDKNTIAIELKEDECSGLRIKIDDGYLFSGLKIGYEKKDYEKANGIFEFNGLHDYSTDFNSKENILEIISPYLADGYGIEFLCQKSKTEDSKSDKDVFIVNVAKSTNDYSTVYSNIVDSEIPEEIISTLYNARLNPFNLLKQNAILAGISVNTLKFTGSTAHSTVQVDGENISSDYNIPEGAKLFEAINYDIASRNIKFPSEDKINGIVKVHYKGKEYEGFIKEISKNPAWETETQWVLWKKH